MKTSKSHIHWLFWFFTDKRAGDFTEVTEVDVLADSLEEATKKAKQFDDRDCFLKRVIEHHDNHDGLTE